MKQNRIRYVSVLLVVTLLTGALFAYSGWGIALAADDDGVFTADDFGRAYAKALLSQVGRGYMSGQGYHVETGGTPEQPARIIDEAFDCYGYVLSVLMAMGYDYFVDSSGRRYALNVTIGAGAIDGVNGIIYNHKTGDRVTLHHKTDSKYNVTFTVGAVVDMTTETEVKTGTLVFFLTNSANNRMSVGSFTEHEVRDLGHAAAALFAMEKTDGITPENYKATENAPGGYDQLLAALETSWNRAREQIALRFGESYARKVDGGSVRSLNQYGYYTPYLWDSRGRGYRFANSADYKRGFTDGHAFTHFTTPYDRIWSAECLNPELGVIVSNNPYGKSAGNSLAVMLVPTDLTGSLVINKATDAPAEAAQTYWFYIRGPRYERWVPVTVRAGATSESVTVSGLLVGEYSVTEVAGEGSTQSVTTTGGVPYLASGEGEVTVPADAAGSITVTNRITKVRIRKSAK
ncbi:MAG: hypothetical protein K6F26_07500 [Lachnospiraceae bacterium]|nr:hypothetical protein [Lachnospiraceae bacterium]